MSLINKMLQDLDARGTPAAEPMQVHIKPVARDERQVSVPLVAAGMAGALAIALAGGFGWRYLHKPAAKPAPAVQPVVGVAPPPAPPAVAPAAVAPAPALAAVSQPEAKAVAKKAKAGGEKPAKAAGGRSARKDDAAADKKRKRDAVQAKDLVAAPKAAPQVPAAAAGRQEASGQRAEDAYRRGLGSLQEGRVGEAIGALEQALQLEPKHDAARQTLVGLLIENKRGDEAIHQLQLGLNLDPRQPALAMLLARLQIERGGSGIETLTRTLPYAAGNGDYQALLAGALQRQQRHREAAGQYQAALRTQPGNGVWWMGLGISLQAEKRNAEALEAFQKAKAVGTLTPELQAFVERRLGQLSR
jgi:MSHA biogenesis protein MshN